MEQQTYQQFYDLEQTHWWFTARQAILVAEIERRLPTHRPLHILDAGCGTGNLLERLRHLGRVEGLDISPDAIHWCQQRGLSHITQGSLVELPYKNDTFDVVIAADVLEHVNHDAQGMAELFRVLKPGGFAVMTVPAYPWLWSGHDTVHHHWRRYTRPDLSQKLEQAGFTINRLTYFNSLLFPGLSLVRGSKKALHRAGTDLQPVIPPLNTFLRTIFLLEKSLLRVTNLPFGLSLLCVASKPGAATPVTTPDETSSRPPHSTPSRLKA